MIQRLPKASAIASLSEVCVPLSFTRLYNRLLRLGIAAALPGRAAIDSPLRRAFDNVQIQIDATTSIKPSLPHETDTFGYISPTQARLVHSLAEEGAAMTRKRLDDSRLIDVVQINGKKARDCTQMKCKLIGEFYYKLTEL